MRLKTSPDWGGGAYVLVTVIQPRDPVATPKPRRALGLLYVPLDPKNRKLTVAMGTPDKIDSKDPVVVPVRCRAWRFGQTRPRDRGRGRRGHSAPDQVRPAPTR